MDDKEIIKYPKLSRQENLSCKLTDEDIKLIRHLRKSGWLLRELSQKFNVCKATITYWTNDKYRKKTLNRMKLQNELERINNPNKYRESSLRCWRRRMKDEKYKEWWRIYALLKYYKNKFKKSAKIKNENRRF